MGDAAARKRNMQHLRIGGLILFEFLCLAPAENKGLSQKKKKKIVV